MTKKIFSQLDTLEEREGIFCIYDENNKPLYVGVGENIRKAIDRVIPSIAPFPVSQKNTRIEVKYLKNEDLAKHFAETIRRKNPLLNISLSAQKNYPYLKLTREKFPRLLVTRRIENDRDDYFGAFLPETGVRFLLDFLIRVFRLRSCTIAVNGDFLVPCTQFYEKKCLAPCVKNICDEKTYRESVQLVRLFLNNDRDRLEKFLLQKIDAYAAVFEFEQATVWRDILLDIQAVWNEKKLKLQLDDAIDSYQVFEGNDQIFIYLVTQRGRKILGKRVFVFKKNGVTEELLIAQFLWQFYEFYAPNEIRVPMDFPDRRFLSKILSRREGRKVEIKTVKSGNKKITTERAFGRAKFEFELEQIKPPLGYENLQNDLAKELKLKRLPKRIECFDVAHISATNFVAAKSVWANGEFLTDEFRYWFFEENSELEMLAKGIETSLETNEKNPDLILIDGGKPQLKAALNVIGKFEPKKFTLIAAVKPPQRHNEVSHFLAENGEIFIMKPNSEAMQLLVRLRDEAHRLANRVHRIIRDTGYFYELASLLPDLAERERRNLLQKFGSVKRLKIISQEDFIKVLGEEKGRKVFVAVNTLNSEKKISPKFLIVPIRYDDPNGEAQDLRPLRLRNEKIL